MKPMATVARELPMLQLMAALDGLDAHVCVLDAAGTVRWVNEPWRRFADENGLPHDRCSEGSDYLGAFGQLRTPAEDEAENGLRQVIAGEFAEFACDYPCHSPAAQRWFHLVARSFRAEGGERGTLVVHSDITARVLAEQERAAVADNLQRMESFEAAARAITHEFNNVLTTLVGNLELVQLRTLPTSPIHELLTEMASAVDGSRKLVTRFYQLTQTRPKS